MFGFLNGLLALVVMLLPIVWMVFAVAVICWCVGNIIDIRESD